MISVYNDILQALEIEYTFITAKDLRTFCFIYKLGSECWYIRSEIPLTEGSIVTLHLKIHGTYIEQPITIFAAHDDYYEIHFTQKTSELQSLFCKIADIETHIHEWEKRKEERYIISLKNRHAFGLRSDEQLLSFGSKNVACLLDDISFSGCRVITYGVDIVPPGTQVILSLSFTNPIERIGLPASIVHCHTRSAENKRFTFLSMRFIDPVHLSFKSRLDRYIASNNTRVH